MKKNPILLIAIFILISPILVMADSNKIIISEFMAINSNNIIDGDGQHTDWIELYNATDAEINLNGWYLSDKADNLKKWKFPSVNIQKGGYLLIFASEKDTLDSAGFLHTNFKLSGSGEFLAVCEPDSTISSSYSPFFIAQRQDVSYGVYQGQKVYFSIPSPGAENNAGSLPFAPNFSITRGFYKTAFDVSLSTASADCSIYYTLDGTRPTKTNGTLYTAPIQITTTTPLSAVSVSADNVSSAIVSNTYWFINDILQQSANPAGYPTDWKKADSKTSITADYEMDPEVCNGAEYKDFMEEALTTVPSMNIVTTKSHLFSAIENESTGGIYIFTGKPSGPGVDWVRPTSVEYYDPKTGKEFQVNCELKLHGGNSRNPSNSSKHGFELKFSSEYGPSKLNFNLFDEKGATNEFNSLVLRSGYNYSWTLLSDLYDSHTTGRLNAQYLQDPWTKATQLEMGKTSGHQRFVHLYLNGLYWGLYNLAEEYTNDFMESYMKGSEEDFDIIKEKQNVTSGTVDAFNALISQMKSDLSNNSNYQKIQGNNADGNLNPAYLNLLDMDNYIDYMLLNYYIGNKDWNTNNWVMTRNRVSNEAGFRFLCWDAETTMTDVSENIVSAEIDEKNPAYFIKDLIGNADFKVLLADRIQKHLLNAGGTLTPTEAINRYNNLANEIDLPIIGESARWGDTNVANKLYTKNEHWLPRKEDLLDNYFPYRTNIVIEQLKNKGYFPSVTAPIFTHNGGIFSASIQLGMSSNKGTVYYTLDGTDPRTQITGDVNNLATAYSNPVAIASSLTVRARAKSGSEWSPITKAKFTYDLSAGWQDLSARQLAYTSYPNPFHDRTQIHLTLPVAGDLHVDIYSIEGRLVEQLYSGKAASGIQNMIWTPQTGETGMYICHITYNGQTYNMKLMVR